MATTTESNNLWLLELKLRMRIGGMSTIEEDTVVKMANDKLGSKATRLLEAPGVKVFPLPPTIPM